MSKKRKITLMLAILSLLFTFNMIETTYAKYVSQSYGNAKLNIARWDIIVNEEHIKNNEELTAEITPNYLDNPNVAPGVIAPGSIGYFDLTIDPSLTDVSFDFEISVSAANTSDVSDLVLYKYFIDDEANTITVDDFNTIITDSISYSEEKTVKKVRIYVMWNDNINTETMNNTSDSIVGHNASEDNANAEVQVQLKFKQKK